MTTRLTAIYNGKDLQLEEPLNVKPNTRVQVTIETSEMEKKESSSFLSTARSLNLAGPSDWSSRLEEYLYGEK